ncbi:MAG: response regulator [Nitrospina sp.]|nr:response regulator [Nitrospina sp.]
MDEQINILDSRILVVDDEPVNVEILDTVLRKDGFRCVDVCTDPVEALRVFQKNPPDLILLDLRMPKIDGFEFMARIREQEKENFTPVIVLTAESAPDIRVRALKAGARDFLSKPLNLAEVLVRCRNILEIRQLHNRLVEQKDKMEETVRKKTAELWATNAQLREEIAERAEIQNWLKRQNELLEIVGQGASLAECIDRIHGFWKTFSESRVCIQLLNRKEPGFRVEYSLELSSELVKKMEALSLSGLPRMFNFAIERDETVVEIMRREPDAEARFLDALYKEGIHTVWTTPIKGREDRILGVLEIYFDFPRSPEKMDRAWAHLISQVAGIVLERSRAEEEIKRINGQLLHSEKLSALGKLSASISHEFNNPILGIRNVLEQVSREDVLDAGLQELTLLAIEECSRVMKLASQLRDFFKPSTGVAGDVDLKRVVEDMILLNKNELVKKGVVLDHWFDPQDLHVFAVEDQIKQVVLNLLHNAQDALPKSGGRIGIRLKREKNNVLLQVEDNGCGIPDSARDRLFEPFFTTKKDTVKGTGLGLSVSYGIVTQSGGEIGFENLPGGGTCFSITLPLKSGPVREMDKPSLSIKKTV